MHCKQYSLVSTPPLDKRPNGYFQFTSSASLTQTATPASVRYVIVPAGNKHTAISACLISIIRACVEAANVGRVTNRIIVVCDACTNATADNARHMLQGYEHLILEHSYKNVGQARAAGAQAARLWSIFDAQQCAPIPFDRTLQPSFQQDWYAFIDVDTCVSPDWLARQAQHHEAGTHAVLGTKPNSASGMPKLLAQLSSHSQRKVDTDWHGANLGIRADYYWLVGGFDALLADEYQQLLLDLDAIAANVVRDPDLTVTTSAPTQDHAVTGRSNDLYALQSGRNQALRADAVG